MPSDTIVVMTIGHSLNIMGALFIIINLIILYYKQPKEQRKLSIHRHNLFMVSIASLFISIGGIIFIYSAWDTNKSICKSQSIWINYWNITSIFWCGCICLNILLSVSFMQDLNQYRNKIIITSHIICWGLPLISPILLILSPVDDFSYESGFCWIASKKSNLRFFLYYMWVLIVWIFNFIVFGLLLIQFCRIKFMKLSTKKSLSIRVILYTAVFIFCWIIGVVTRIIQIFDNNWNIEFLKNVHAFLISSNAFFFSLAFIYCENLLEEYSIDCREILKNSENTPLKLNDTPINVTYQ